VGLAASGTMHLRVRLDQENRQIMYVQKRLAAALAVVVTAAAAAPAVAGAAIPAPSFAPPGLPDNSQLCLHGIVDPGPFGPMGPYGPLGPYGANGPLHGSPNPIGNAATCGGLLTYVLRGGTLDQFVQGNLQASGN
jgi:hypothetical protein